MGPHRPGPTLGPGESDSPPSLPPPAVRPSSAQPISVAPTRTAAPTHPGPNLGPGEVNVLPPPAQPGAGTPSAAGGTEPQPAPTAPPTSPGAGSPAPGGGSGSGGVGTRGPAAAVPGILGPPQLGSSVDVPPSTASTAKEAPARRQSSAAGVRTVEYFEGWRDHPYNDSLGNATIGYGHLLHEGPVTSADLRQWGTITRAEGQRLLKADMTHAVEAVKKLVKVPLTQAQFDALASFTFNIGIGGFAHSEALADLNGGRYGRVPSDFLHWDHDGEGNVVPGLRTRRRAEGELFAHGIYPSGE